MQKIQYQNDNYTEEELRKALTERFSNVRQKRLREFQQFGKIQSKDFELSAMRSSAGNFKSQDNSEPTRLGNFLKAVEVGLLLAFLFLGISGWSLLNKTNRETRSNWEIPAVTPTPLITPIVLPSGHELHPIFWTES